jgi:HAMP domain-containing protein/CheY-like chemotaxis protein/putative methionine-R-sulfoxide reductase with GAF domain
VPPLPTRGARAESDRKTRPTRKTTARPGSENGAGTLTEAQLARLTSALEAARDGDFSVRLRAEGALADVATVFNTLVERNQQVTRELVRVSKVVGREGRITERAGVAGAPGSWAEKVGAVNELIDNLARPTIEVARVIDAVADGDLRQRIQLEIDGQPVRGEFRRIGTTVNAMVDQLSSFAAEVTRVAREVGTEGKLGGQARVKGVSGTWKDLTDSVNQMASNLTGQVRNIADVTTAVANGDLSKKVTVDVKGEVLELKNTVNTMVDQLSSFADEVTRVAREVGTDGNLGGQAQVKGVSGVWKDLTENVNTLAGNLTSQVRNIAAVTTAVANGDLSKKITVDVKGEVLELKETINTMVDQLRSFSAEVTRVAKEVGTEGKLGGQAQVEGVSGVWKDLTENVNTLADNLSDQVRNIADVTTAVANGDLSKKITVEVRGEVLEVKETVNTMVDQLRSFAAEVTRVAREVGTEGRLGGQAQVEGVSGVWKDLTDNVNTLAGNLTSQVRNIAAVTTAVANGDLSKKITVDVAGEVLELKDTINTMVDQLSSFAAEVTRVAREVGTEGKLGGQAQVEGVSGTWRGLTENVNTLANNLTDQVRNIAEVTTAVAQGNLSKKITVDARGEVLQLKDTINTMVDQLSSFAAEVTRVAKEVGTEGKLGGQAQVEGVSGTWRGLTENVNLMADNLTAQVRSIAEVTTAVARGDLTQKITIETKGELAQLASTINTMVDQLSAFAAEVTRVAREVGTEGKLGGQATVEGVSGTWKDLTDTVNQLSYAVTLQIRAIADVSTAVTSGDLSRSIDVEAAGELSDLKDNVNQMIGNLRETTERNAAQDWLNSNLARFSGMLQGQRDQKTVAKLLMSEVTPLVAAHHGAFYVAEDTGDDEETELRLIATYGYKERKTIANRFKIGEAIVGQAALEKKAIVITQAPEDYIKIASGLGESAPTSIIVLPVLFEENVMAVMELASFTPFTEIQQTFLDQLSESIGVVLNTILANMRTEELLLQSQQLTQDLQSQSEELQAQQDELKRSNAELEAQTATLRASEELLQTQQEELQQTNEELEERSQQLEEQNRRIEIKNAEIEEARSALEEKAEQLALSSRYKSEFLANMSHELRTPLNSLLILAKLLGDNPDGNLTEKQIEFATTIHNAGSELLGLINDILDLSKVEAGKMDLNVGEVSVAEELAGLERSFMPVAAEKGLSFELDFAENALPTIVTDQQRLQQVLKNLLSNAFKFTDSGGVVLRVGQAVGRQFAGDVLSKAERVIGFSVVDTGVGIPHDKLRLIFEAFQQADGTTSRRYGGTGLGLSISREIARLLGGEIHVESAPGTGSTFTLYLPEHYVATAPAATPAELLEAVSAGLSPATAASHNGDEPDLDPMLLVTSEVEDDRESIEVGDRVVLIVEDDADFARTELEIARERGFKGLVALRGDTGLALAREFRPDAIVLDMSLPVLDGWTVLDRLKRHPATRHIPVHIVSGMEEMQPALMAGAAAFVQKPASLEALEGVFGGIESFIDRDVRRLLVVDDDEAQRDAIVELVGGDGDVEIVAVGSSEEALAALEAEPEFDCMVLDLKLPKMTGFDLLEKVKTTERSRALPVIVYTGKDLTRREETKLKRYAETIVIKDARSPERLLDETSLFLHRVESKLPDSKRKMLEQLHNADAVFLGKKVLIVDDDVRNVFALTSALEANGMEVLFAENGREGIEALKRADDVDLVLMDVMMPEMDGYETTQAIRLLPEFEKLPIIALTAKAMKGDRERSIAAGASDYITKPVDTDQLLSLMRVWLYQ